MRIGYADLVFAVRYEGAGRLPAFRGTTLRGALGYALRSTVCGLRRQECTTCLLRNRCAFPNVFEGVAPADRNFMRKYPFMPQPFVMRVRHQAPSEIRAGDADEFGIRCFGSSLAFYPYIVMAVIEAGRRGLGRDRIPFTVTRISDGTEVIHDPAHGGDLRTPAIRAADAAPADQRRPVRLHLDFVTPVRIRTGGSINRLPGLPAIVRAAIRRLRILHHFYGEGEGLSGDVTPLLDSAAAAGNTSSSLRPYSLRRRSTRQRTDMELDGVVGGATYELNDGTLIPLFQMAEACHIGKATSFGFGRIAYRVSHP